MMSISKCVVFAKLPPKKDDLTTIFLEMSQTASRMNCACRDECCVNCFLATLCFSLSKQNNQSTMTVIDRPPFKIELATLRRKSQPLSGQTNAASGPTQTRLTRRASPDAADFTKEAGPVIFFFCFGLVRRRSSPKMDQLGTAHESRRADLVSQTLKNSARQSLCHDAPASHRCCASSARFCHLSTVRTRQSSVQSSRTLVDTNNATTGRCHQLQ